MFKLQPSFLKLWIAIVASALSVGFMQSIATAAPKVKVRATSPKVSNPNNNRYSPTIAQTGNIYPLNGSSPAQKVRSNRTKASRSQNPLINLLDRGNGSDNGIIHLVDPNRSNNRAADVSPLDDLIK